MAAGTVSTSNWRFVFGDTEEWMPPKTENQPTMGEATPSAVSWRVIFGNTAKWLPPQLEKPESLAENASAERCELCRQPIADGEDFVTNSAGQLPAHARCLGLQSRAATAPKLPPRSWVRLLYEFVKS